MGSKSFFIQTFGCTSNKFDSEKMIALLKNAGYSIAKSEKDADYLLVNTCAVKSVTEERIIHRLNELSKLDKKLFIAGCLTKVNPQRIQKTVPNFSAMIDPQSIHKIVDVVKAVENGKEQIIQVSKKPIEKLLLPRFSFSDVISIIKISEGCLSNCSFCATKLARGTLYSYRPDVIRDAVKVGLQEGFREFHLTSEDSSAYGRDIGTNLADLLKSITRIGRKFFLRVGMMNPLHFKKIELQEVVEAFKNEKIFKFLHLCVQSGSNKVLKDMRRGYTAEDFIFYVKQFRKEIPKITLETDVIVGFPTETEEDFKQTVQLLKKTKPALVNISKYGARPGTYSAKKWKQLPPEVVNNRSRLLQKVVRKISLKENKKWIGWEGEAIVDEKVKDAFVARNFAYKPIVLKENVSLGSFVRVKIFDAKENFLVGKIV
jgi:MiaB-like tRNA modifying enzyme